MRSRSPNIQSRYVIFFFLMLAVLLGLSRNVQAQTTSTLTLTDTTVIGNNARLGLTVGGPMIWQPYIKNYVGFQNPGFELVIQQQIYQIQDTNSYSSLTSCQWDVNNAQSASYDDNQWAEATFNVIRSNKSFVPNSPRLWEPACARPSFQEIS